MEDYKIIQIIPVNKELYSKYEDDGEEFTAPIVCFALIEDEYNYREVVPMDMDSFGTIDIVKSGSTTEIVNKPII